MSPLYLKLKGGTEEVVVTTTEKTPLNVIAPLLAKIRMISVITPKSLLHCSN